MTEDQKKDFLKSWIDNMDECSMDSLIDEYHGSQSQDRAESLYCERTIDTDSLPVWAAELLTEVRFRLLVDIDHEGEPRSSMTELLDMWDKVNKALAIKAIGE